MHIVRDWFWFRSQSVRACGAYRKLYIVRLCGSAAAVAVCHGIRPQGRPPFTHVACVLSVQKCSGAGEFRLEAAEHGLYLPKWFLFALKHGIARVHSIGGQEARYIRCAALEHGPQREIPIVHVAIGTKPSDASMQALPENHIAGRN